MVYSFTVQFETSVKDSDYCNVKGMLQWKVRLFIVTTRMFGINVNNNYYIYCYIWNIVKLYLLRKLHVWISYLHVCSASSSSRLSSTSLNFKFTDFAILLSVSKVIGLITQEQSVLTLLIAPYKMPGVSSVLPMSIQTFGTTGKGTENYNHLPNIMDEEIKKTSKSINSNGHLSIFQYILIIQRIEIGNASFNFLFICICQSRLFHFVGKSIVDLSLINYKLFLCISQRCVKNSCRC